MRTRQQRGVVGLRLAICVVGLAFASQAAGAEVPAEFHGDWVPEAATCNSPARMKVSADRLTLVNGKDSASYGNIAIPTSYFGPDYNGISVVAIPEIDSDDPPFSVYFNAEEKKGITQVDIYQEMKGATNAQVQAIQAAHKKLADRFPALNRKPLKKCEAEKGGG